MNSQNFGRILYKTKWNADLAVQMKMIATVQHGGHFSRVLWSPCILLRGIPLWDIPIYLYGFYVGRGVNAGWMVRELKKTKIIVL